MDGIRLARPKGGRRGIGLGWLGLAVWVGFLIAIDIASRTIGLDERQIPYLVAAALASLGVVTLAAFLRLANSPPELRMLRVLAVLAPSAFVLCIEVILYFVEIDEKVTEVGEHVVATAILSAGAVPFSVYVFRAFTRLRDELAHRAQHLQALHETSVSITGGSSRGLLRARIANGVREVVSSDRAGVLLRTGGGANEAVTPSPPEAQLGAWETGLIHSLRDTGIANVSEGERSFLGVPVRGREGAIGVMAAIRDQGPPFSVEDELLLGMFAVAASAGVENARRLEETHLLATVDERERIARDLHDDMGQLLGFLTTKIQATQELVNGGREGEAVEELRGLERATRTLGAQVREAILGLRARVGPDRPLGPALEDYVAEFGIQAGLSTDFAADPDAGAGLPAASQYQLLRVAQEALSNARRHARAERVAVQLRESDGFVELEVADDGTGFGPDDPGSGFGLKTMAERVQALGGTFEVRSTPGSGTIVAARIPAEGS